MGGHLDVLKWAREHGAPWDEKTCYHAASYAAVTGQLDILQWARDNGAPWDHKIWQHGWIGRNGELTDWLRQNGAPRHLDPLLLY